MTFIQESVFPKSAAERDRWILERRGPRVHVEPEKPYLFLVEDERFATGEVGKVATIFLTNPECPWRCTMCDLWKHTLPGQLLPGAIPRQIEYALSRLPNARQIKLYNSGSFFDPSAIPVEDYPEIAALLRSFERVIVECHPALVGRNCFDFADRIEGRLEVAMGLETAHPGVLKKLNKRMTVSDYAGGADRLRRRGIDLRSFILVQPPFMQPAESLEWACRSMDFAFECGATATSLIPTRGGNGAMEALAASGEFASPELAVIEDAVHYGLGLKLGRVFVDLWDAEKIECLCTCRAGRLDRLAKMNLSQTVTGRMCCSECGG